MVKYLNKVTYKLFDTLDCYKYIINIKQYKIYIVINYIFWNCINIILILHLK